MSATPLKPDSNYCTSSNTCLSHPAGEMERLQKFWLAGACKMNNDEGEASMPLGILNFTSAFILLAGGMLLGGLLLLLEHTYFKFFRTKLRKWDKCGCCGLVSLVSHACHCQCNIEQESHDKCDKEQRQDASSLY